MRIKPLRRAIAAAALGVAALPVMLVPVATATGSRACGTTTLQGRIIESAGKGRLTCAPGERLGLREDLGAKASPRRTSLRDALVSFVALTDFQLMDEESPLRGEWTDKCDRPQDGFSSPVKAAFRWNETMIPALINAEIQAANAIARGPVTGRAFDFGVQLGDAADNQQWNEVRSFITLLDGSQAPDGNVHLVDPDSGDDGYEGVQGRDPIASPIGDTSVLDLANEPFFAPGLRRPDGSRLPWYSVMGNHDMKVQGTITNAEGWKQFARAWVIGRLKVTDLAPDQQQRVCQDPSRLTDPDFWMEVATTPGTTRVVTPDEDRRLLDRTQWIAEHLPAAKAKELDPAATGSYGLPDGHGFLTPGGADNRCRGEDGVPLSRACYSFDVAGDRSLPRPVPLHVIAMDTNADEGLETGNLSPEEFAWLERDLIAHSSAYYDSSGALIRNPKGRNALIVAMSHHTGTTTNNAGDPNAFDGQDLEALFLRFPNFILHMSGHTHQNKVWAHADPNGKTGYWEVNTSSVADWPHQGRTIEIADNHDGTISIIGVNFDAFVAPNPRDVAWTADPTPELRIKQLIKDPDERDAVKRNVNENWLASAAREVGFNDPQTGAAAAVSTDAAQDRNVELLVRNPFGQTAARTRVSPTRSGPGFFQPPSFFDPTLPPLPRPPLPFPFPNPGGSGELPPPGFRSTAKGLGAPSTSAIPFDSVRAGFLVLLAFGGAAWLLRGRIRSWMVLR